MEKSKKFFENAFNLPNSLSFFRLLLVIPFYFLLQEIHTDYFYRIYILGLILIGFISDILDGYLARKMNIITEFGKIIDPLADKACVILIIIQLYLLEEIPEIYLWIILGRDILIFFGGIYVSRKIGKVLPSNMLGKITVLTIGFFIIATIVGLEFTNFIYRLLFYLSILLSFGSVIAYAIRGYEAVKWTKNGIV